MVSVLHKELEYKVEKLKIKKVGGHAPKDQHQINHPGLIHTKFYSRLQLWLTDTVSHLIVRNN